MADDAAEVQLGPEELASLHAALRTFVRDPDAHATVTWPASAPGKRRRGAHVRHALWILKSMLRDAQGGRWAVECEGSEETVRVRTDNLTALGEGGEGGECTPLLGGYAEEFVWVQVDEPLPDA